MIRVNPDGSPLKYVSEDEIARGDENDDPTSLECSCVASTAIFELVANAYRGHSDAPELLLELAWRIVNGLNDLASRTKDKSPIGSALETLIRKSDTWPVMLPADVVIRKQSLKTIDALPIGEGLEWRIRKGGKGRPRDLVPSSPSQVAKMVLQKMLRIRDISTPDKHAASFFRLPVDLIVRIRNLPKFNAANLKEWQQVAVDFIDTTPFRDAMIPEIWKDAARRSGCGFGAHVRKELEAGLKAICPA